MPRQLRQRQDETASPQPASELPIDKAFPVAFANNLARLESYNKHLYRPNTYLHKWWARRCGTTFRLILKHLIHDPESRSYYQPGGLEGLTILDPMLGGGTTLHEAIRLGANVIGADIDPIPILQARATLTRLPLAELEEGFDALFQNLRQDLAHLFQTTCPDCAAESELSFVLYGRNQECDCGLVLTVDSTILRYESDGSIIALCPACGDVYRSIEDSLASAHTCSGPALSTPILEKGDRLCPSCGKPPVDLTHIPFYARYTPVALAGRCGRHGLFFKSPAEADMALIKEANNLRLRLGLETEPGFQVRPGPKSNSLTGHGVHSYLDLFSSRQLLYLHAATSHLEQCERLLKLNLGLLVSTSTEFNTLLCGYKGGARRRPGAIRHAFAHHAYSFPYTALENNPLNPRKGSGTLQALFHARIRRGRKWAIRPAERLLQNQKVKEIVEIKGELDSGVEVAVPAQLLTGHRRFMLIQGSSASIKLADDSVDHIVTDPPYFDNVQYSDLSAFFRVWLKRLLAREAGWEIDLTISAVDPQANGEGQYDAVLGGIFKECYRVLKKESGRLIFTFHHWNPQGWADLTNALKEAGFLLLARYVIHSENPASVHITNLNSLAHDAVLVMAAHPAASGHDWPAPGRINKDDSEIFVGDCAAALGWMLASDLDRPQIKQRWLALLS